MKKNLNINAIRNGKKVSKSLGFVNPDVANSLVGGFAQMVNALTNDTFVNSEVVKVMDTSEEESSSTPTPAPAGKTEGVITLYDIGNDRTASAIEKYSTYRVDYNGDATLKLSYYPMSIQSPTATLESGIFQAGSSNLNCVIYAEATDNYTAAVYSFLTAEE